jgi:hypothetical protein
MFVTEGESDFAKSRPPPLSRFVIPSGRDLSRPVLVDNADGVVLLTDARAHNLILSGDLRSLARYRNCSRSVSIESTAGKPVFRKQRPVGGRLNVKSSFCSAYSFSDALLALYIPQ